MRRQKAVQEEDGVGVVLVEDDEQEEEERDRMRPVMSATAAKVSRR